MSIVRVWYCLGSAQNAENVVFGPADRSLYLGVLRYLGGFPRPISSQRQEGVRRREAIEGGTKGFSLESSHLYESW